jgi:hypothetical protein
MVRERHRAKQKNKKLTATTKQTNATQHICLAAYVQQEQCNTHEGDHESAEASMERKKMAKSNRQKKVRGPTVP